MLPDFPKVRGYANKILMQWFRKRVSERSGIMAELPAEVLYEGNTVKFHRYDGSIQTIGMKSGRTALKLEKESFRKKRLSAVIEAMDQTASDMATQQTRSFFSQLNQICDEAGQTYDAKGQRFSYDLILNLLETIDIDFDENGEPKMPTILSGPEVCEKMKNVKETEEQRERFGEIIERKRSDWRERESRRRLVS